MIFPKAFDKSTLMKLLKVFSFALICLFSVQLAPTDVVQAETNRKQRVASKKKKKHRRTVYYRVRRGDTLGKIARRYRTSVAQLRRWNRMSPRSILKAGVRLRVGSTAARPRKKAKKITVGNRWLSNSPYTKVLTPVSYKLPEPFQKLYTGDDYRLRIYAEKFAQGHAGYLEILPPDEEKRFEVTDAFTVQFHDKKVPITAASWGYRGLFAIPPNRKPGKYRLSVVHRSAGDKVFTRHFTIPVTDTKYPKFTRRVYLGRAKYFKPMKPEIKELIRRGRLKKDQVFALNTGNKITSRLSHPRDMHKVTSAFYTTRTILQYYRKNGKKIYKKPRVRPHKGLDLRGRWGDPIIAMADGRVVCAMRMHAEGNFTVIDHGNQIFTGYMHQSKFHVSEGQFVKAGQTIGESGNTGASTGPHLHIALWIRGVPVQPLSLLSLPIR